MESESQANIKTNDAFRYVRITNSAKLSDRYVTTQVKESHDPEANAAGRIFTLVEIESPWFPNSQIGQTLINTASREYFRGADRDPLVNFETALKKINETLGHLAQTGQTDWLGHLNAVLILVIQDEIHITTCGTIHGWLIREGKASNVFDSSSPVNTPNKTFSTVLSGKLESGDRFLFGSIGLLTVSSVPELKANVFSVPDLGTAAHHLTNILKTKKGRWVNALLLESPSLASQANQTLTRSPEVFYLDSNGVSDWRLTGLAGLKRLHEIALTAGGWLKVWDRRLDTAFRIHALPRSKQTLAQFKNWSRTHHQEFREKTLPALRDQIEKLKNRRPAAPPDVLSKTHPSSDLPTPPTKTESLIGKSVFAIHDYTAPSSDNLGTVGAVHVYDQVPQTHPTAKFPLPTLLKVNFASRSAGFIVLAAILIVLLGINLRALATRRGEEQKRVEATAQLQNLEDKLEEGKLAKIFNQTEKAQTLFAEVITGVATLENSPVTEIATQVRDEAQTALDELTKTTRLKNLASLAEFEQGSSLTRWDNKLTIVENSKLITLPENGGEQVSVVSPANEKITAIGVYDEKIGALVSTDKPALYELTDASGPLNALNPQGANTKLGQSLAAFFNNLYLLAPSENQIWKFPSVDGALQAPEAFITDGTQISDGIDLAIDGNVYVLSKLGEVIKLNRGKRVEFRIHDIPAPASNFTSPKQILTTREGGKIYVVDGERIVVLGSDGRFQNQYVLDGVQALDQIAVDEDGKVFWVLAENKLYKAGF
ncbi:hypothetical protein HYW32_03195 [Candidatus Berkelbacteria bacterium]|nr:hypothetical protein [Candidatus Berkelbacteria bacterium]